jgi:hypothetical protein
MSDTSKIIAGYVYYRDIPAALTMFVSSNASFSYTKDGVMKGVGHNCPRITITYKPKTPQEDTKCLERLERLLADLLSNNQIVDYSVSNF